MTNAEEALSILQQKEQEKQRTEVIKEARRQKKKSNATSKNIKKLRKTTKEIAAPSNILQIKSVYFNTSKHKCF